MNNLDIRSATIDDITNILPLMLQLGYPSNLKELNTRFKNFINNDGYEAERIIFEFDTNLL